MFKYTVEPIFSAVSTIFSSYSAAINYACRCEWPTRPNSVCRICSDWPRKVNSQPDILCGTWTEDAGLVINSLCYARSFDGCTGPLRLSGQSVTRVSRPRVVVASPQLYVNLCGLCLLRYATLNLCGGLAFPPHTALQRRKLHRAAMRTKLATRQLLQLRNCSIKGLHAFRRNLLMEI